EADAVAADLGRDADRLRDQLGAPHRRRELLPEALVVECERVEEGDGPRRNEGDPSRNAARDRVVSLWTAGELERASLGGWDVLGHAGLLAGDRRGHRAGDVGGAVKVAVDEALAPAAADAVEKVTLTRLEIAVLDQDQGRDRPLLGLEELLLSRARLTVGVVAVAVADQQHVEVRPGDLIEQGTARRGGAGRVLLRAHGVHLRVADPLGGLVADT